MNERQNLDEAIAALLEAAKCALEHIEEWIERPEREDADGMYVPLGGERAVMELLGDAIEKAEGV